MSRRGTTLRSSRRPSGEHDLLVRTGHRTRSGSGEYAQIDAADNDRFIGGPGPILNGQDKNDFAIEGAGTNVTIEYLTIENFTAPQSQGAVNQDLAAAGWSRTRPSRTTPTGPA